MSEVFISHAREDRAACELLADALGCAGLSVILEQSVPPPAPENAPSGKTVKPALATVVLWSRAAIMSEQVKLEADYARQVRAKDGSKASTRYVGLILDDTPQTSLPDGFSEIPAAAWAPWFHTKSASFDDPVFVSLLSALETLTGRQSLTTTARALAVRDAEAARLRAIVTDQDSSLEQLRSSKSSLEAQVSARVAEVAQRDSEIADLGGRVKGLIEKHSALESAHDALLERVRVLDEQVRDAIEDADSARALLDQANQALRKSQDSNQTLDRDLEDARNGLAAALRQQKSLQGQIEADDQTIRHIMTQREELIQARDKLEKERARLSLHLGETERRLSDSEQRRETYVVSLVERKKEIDALSDKLAVSVTDATHSAQQAESLRTAVQSWAHVPWRSIAAGSVAAGALLAAGGIFAGQAVDAYLSPPAHVAATNPALPATPPPFLPADSLVPKSEAQVAPDTLQIVESADSGDTSAVDPVASSDPGAISIPDESGTPAVNDQVQFNPDGLPPIDPDSRPPPQDLPPMQQRPRLLLKPPTPPSGNQP